MYSKNYVFFRGFLFKFVCFVTTEIKMGEFIGMTAQTKIFEIVLGRITDQKLDENNYLYWKRIIEIYVAGREKTSHLLVDLPQ